QWATGAPDHLPDRKVRDGLARLLRAAGFRDVRSIRCTAVRGHTPEHRKFTGGRCTTERPAHHGRDADGREPGDERRRWEWTNAPDGQRVLRRRQRVRHFGRL